MGGAGDNLHGGTGADTFAVLADNDLIVEDFDATADVIELTYEGKVPELSTMETEDGLVLMADGTVVATFLELADLDIHQITLVAA
ncbi:hypothetical protein QTO30_14950 [Yoonia sp. GPGPB17]|uniref:hypothetical protein n=1 Tax=Yoonia sp. GPGPB17 TaxID=3026147 RepID=UPI0030BB6650